MTFLRKIQCVVSVVLLTVGSGVSAAQEEAVEPVVPLPEPVKVLTIGNSFAQNATSDLPDLAKAGGKNLLLFKANPGGCTLERHAGWLKKFRENPEGDAGRPYPSAFVPSREEPGKKYSLPEILAEEDWDFVTIQQLSNLSFKAESFEPYAKELVECIREFAPKAEILIHQTWAYREDYPGFANGKFTQAMMYEQLEANYKALAERYGLRIIPVGKAFQEARVLPRWTFKFPDPTFNYKAPEAGTKPDQTGSLNSGWSIQKIVKKVLKTEAAPAEDLTAGEPAPSGPEAAEVPEEIVTYKANLDFKHCNAEGRYLGGAVWYGFLFGEEVSPSTFAPPGIKPEDAVALRGIADKVLAGYKQVVPAPKK